MLFTTLKAMRGAREGGRDEQHRFGIKSLDQPNDAAAAVVEFRSNVFINRPTGV